MKMAGTCSTVEPAGAGEIMLFGVRVVIDSMRKSVSLNNLSQYEQPQEGSNNNSGNNTIAGKDDVAGYASENDVVHNSGGNRERERKRGVPWTEEEHKLFLLGLQKVGKGDWRGISRNFVKTRTPTQVASHAQKYFLRRNNHNRRRRRSSLSDITTDTVTATPMDEEQVHHQNNNASAKLVRPIALHSAPHATEMSDLNLKSTMDTSTLTLNLSLSMDPRESSSRHSAFQAMPSFSNGDSIISVA